LPNSHSILPMAAFAPQGSSHDRFLAKLSARA
jgi:hypothetical protein